MKKQSTLFSCQSCRGVFRKWAGQCEVCGEWNSIVEDSGIQTPYSPKAESGLGVRQGQVAFHSLDCKGKPLARIVTGIDEFDRATGGGLVEGGVVLVGGDPGIGKSTLLLQVVAALAMGGNRVAYISGEEAVSQVQFRAQRLEVSHLSVSLASETRLTVILETLKQQKFDVVIIDSIQTMWLETIQSAPGSVMQVRACTHELVTCIKRLGTSMILIGHVTKDGQLAGPRVIEHMVDTVMYFEGEKQNHFRILRAIKNRFGPANEIGVFEMTCLGLQEVSNPSQAFLGDHQTAIPGSVVFAGIEGSRPVLIEIQALVVSSNLGTSRRSVIGWDAARLSMILAVLEARCGVNVRAFDVYLNVAGGLRITEPAADVAVVAAVISAYRERCWDFMSTFFGEISLSGLVKATTQADLRVRESAKLGFSKSVIPEMSKLSDSHALSIRKIRTVEEMVRDFDNNTVW
jgi:DNA repair protein RadA/Sms